MRRNYISPEFIYKKVNGTFNTLEQSSFFGSKMLNIADNIAIKNDNVIYYQNSNFEQIDINSERNISQVIYDSVVDKKKNHKITIDDSQTEIERNGNAKWILDIQLRAILRNSIFATLKKFRTFEGVLNNMTINNSVDSAISDYIDKNILPRYKFSKIELFYKEIDLLTIGGLKYNNQFDDSIESGSTLITAFETNTDSNDIDLRLKFSQQKSADYYAFRYYYNLYFDKI